MGFRPWRGSCGPQSRAGASHRGRSGLGCPLAGRCQDLAHSHIIAASNGGRLLQGLGRRAAVGVTHVQQVLVN